MPTYLIELLRRMNPASQNIATQAIIDWLGDKRTEEASELVMQAIVAAAEECGIGASSINVHRLRHALLVLLGKHVAGWSRFLGVLQLNIDAELYKQLFAHSPFAGEPARA